MSALVNIITKELKELITPATFIPIIILALVFSSMGGTIGGIEGQLEEKPVIGLISLDDGNYSILAENIFKATTELVYNSGSIDDKDEALKIIEEKEGLALVIIDSDFSVNILSGKTGEFQIYWIMRGAGVLDSISSSVLEGIMSEIDKNITREIIQKNNKDINTTTALNPTNKNFTTYFKNNEFKGVSPSQIANKLSTQSLFIPLIMVMIIMMAGQLVISSMALEKENKTLETLLTLPVRRSNIVTGKIIAAAIVGLILAAIYMVGIGFYMQSFQIETGTGATSIDLSLSSFDFLLIGISVFVTLVAALAFCMLLGTLAKNFKSAQTLTFPVAILALIPMILTIMKDFDTLPIALKALLFAIPFSHPMMAPRFLIFGDYFMIIAGIIYVLIFALIMIIIVVWIFKTDRIIIGTTKFKLKKIFKKSTK